jgi:hypothetical protein
VAAAGLLSSISTGPLPPLSEPKLSCSSDSPLGSPLLLLLEPELLLSPERLLLSELLLLSPLGVGDFCFLFSCSGASCCCAARF